VWHQAVLCSYMLSGLCGTSLRAYCTNIVIEFFYLVLLLHHPLLLYLLHFVKFLLNKHGMVWYHWYGIQSNMSMHHYECVTLCFVNILQ